MLFKEMLSCPDFWVVMGFVLVTWVSLYVACTMKEEDA